MRAGEEGAGTGRGETEPGGGGIGQGGEDRKTVKGEGYRRG